MIGRRRRRRAADSTIKTKKSALFSDSKTVGALLPSNITRAGQVTLNWRLGGQQAAIGQQQKLLELSRNGSQLAAKLGNNNWFNVTVT